MDWGVVCPHTPDEEVYVMGNPPYLGARLQEETHKSDLEITFGDTVSYNNLDYISAWFYRGAKYAHKSIAKLAFVSTNSISQGEQVALIWSNIFALELEIYFAYTSFKWNNNAKYNAGVTCSIIGLRRRSNDRKYIYSADIKKDANNINAYLLNSPNIIINKRTNPISLFPQMDFGSMPNDGGHLLLDASQKEYLLSTYPQSIKLIKNFKGSQEFIRGEDRFCLWITPENVEIAHQITPVISRISECQKHRAESKREATNKLSSIPLNPQLSLLP